MLKKNSLEMCTPTLQTYTEKNQGALYVHYHKLQAFRVFFNGLQYYHFLNHEFKCSCTRNAMSEPPLIHLLVTCPRKYLKWRLLLSSCFLMLGLQVVKHRCFLDWPRKQIIGRKSNKLITCHLFLDITVFFSRQSLLLVQKLFSDNAFYKLFYTQLESWIKIAIPEPSSSAKTKVTFLALR